MRKLWWISGILVGVIVLGIGVPALVGHGGGMHVVGAILFGLGVTLIAILTGRLVAALMKEIKEQEACSAGEFRREGT